MPTSCIAAQRPRASLPTGKRISQTLTEPPRLSPDGHFPAAHMARRDTGGRSGGLVASPREGGEGVMVGEGTPRATWNTSRR